jgi:ferredoxin-NADP reductase
MDELHRLEALNEGRRAQRLDTQRIIDRYHPKRLRLEVGEVIEETPTCKTLRLVSRDGYLPPFQAGQYVNLFVTVDGVATSRPMAISSSPGERGHYDLTVRKIQNGFVSRYLVDEAKAGDRFDSTGPMGNFYFNPIFHSPDVVFLAGGSGVAPAMSMIRDLLESGADRRFHLIYGSMDLGDVIFRDELDVLAETHDRLTVTTVITNPPEGYDGHRGYITAELIREVVDGEVDGVGDKSWFICGPQAMYPFCAAELGKLGVPARSVRFEANGPPARPEKLAGWPQGLDPDTRVTVRLSDGRSFTTPVGEPLLNALERQGIQLEAACRSGECSLCRCKVVGGTVFEPTEARVRKSDRQYVFVHSCVTFPTSDIELDVG